MVEHLGCFPGDSSSIPAIRRFVIDLCHQVWSSPDDADALAKLELAVSEAASNIVLHGFQGEPDGQIEIQVDVSDKAIRLVFQYPGIAFFPRRAPAPDFSGTAESGYGLYLIQKCVDEIHYNCSTAGICRIEFLKKRK